MNFEGINNIQRNDAIKRNNSIDFKKLSIMKEFIKRSLLMKRIKKEIEIIHLIFNCQRLLA
jgi:hypothetical protein